MHAHRLLSRESRLEALGLAISSLFRRAMGPGDEVLPEVLSALICDFYPALLRWCERPMNGCECVRVEDADADADKQGR